MKPIFLTINQAKENLATCIRAQLVALITGSPGCGKSDLVRQVAAQYGLKVIDFRLAQCDPVDLNGFPTIDPVTGRAGYAPMDTFPLEGDPIPEGYTGWILFFDELTSAMRAVQAASYKVMLDRMIGQRKLHKNVAIVGAGNLESDNAIVEEMSTALQSRLVHMQLQVDLQEFLDYAATKSFDRRITSYLSFKKGHLYTFKPDHSDRTYACPRTWEFVDRLLKTGLKLDLDDMASTALLQGTISPGVAHEFLTFVKLEDEIPKMSEIRRNPEGVTMPNDRGVLWSLTGAIAHTISPDSAKDLMIFVKRMPIECQVVTMRDVVRRKPEMKPHPAVQNWLVESAIELF